jgi:hypothetical protein
MASAHTHALKNVDSSSDLHGRGEQSVHAVNAAAKFCESESMCQAWQLGIALPFATSACYKNKFTGAATA